MAEDLRFCPNCGSTRVKPDSSNAAAVAIYGGNNQKWMCKDCDYTGIMPQCDPEEDFISDEEREEIELDEDEKLDFKPNEEYSRVDLSVGRGYAKYLLYITMPTAAILIIDFLVNS